MAIAYIVFACSLTLIHIFFCKASSVAVLSILALFIWNWLSIFLKFMLHLKEKNDRELFTILIAESTCSFFFYTLSLGLFAEQPQYVVVL